jgi:hypothetical protein
MNFKKLLPGAAVLILLLFSIQAFGQGGDASLSGTIADASGAVLPGASVVATSDATGVSTSTVTNAAGIYSFPSLQPGTYAIKVELAGFQTTTLKNVLLRGRAQARLNATLEVRKLEQSVEVSVAGDDVLLERSSSVGLVLPKESVANLPLVNNNVLDLVKVMGGYIPTDNNPIFAAGENTMAGVSVTNVNLQVEGVTVNPVRWQSGMQAPVRLNNELVSEFKVVLATVDAEVGRGAGQVQILTKSGANDFHGSLVWNIQNSVLDSNEYFYNRTGGSPDWRNMNEYSLSLGGPIRKNKTFFFVLWNGQTSMQKGRRNPTVLTPCARKGIFRYFDGWANGNILSSTTTTGFTPTRPVVDANGVPLAITQTPTGAPASLHYASVFGPLLKTPQTNDCSDFNPATDIDYSNPWHAAAGQFRPDTTGYISRFSAIMPQANNYEVGDGLNVAGSKWTLALHGGDNVFGLGEDQYRKQFTVKIDHNFNDRHRISGSYSWEDTTADDSFPQWPNGYGGWIQRKPLLVSTRFTSTLKPTLLNEFSFGLSEDRSMTYDALGNPKTGDKMKAILMELLPTDNFPGWKGLPVHGSPGRYLAGFHTDAFTTGGAFTGFPQSNVFGSRGNLAVDFGGKDPRWVFGDTLTWMRGRHSFKMGGEHRRSKSYQERSGTGRFFNDANVYPSAIGGITTFAPITGINATNMPGLIGTPGAFGSGNVRNMEGLLSYMSGSLAEVRQYVYVNDPNALSWSNYAAGDRNQIFDIRMKEFSLFFKDDWKVNDSLTLNLGVRYEYYGVPYLQSGMAVALQGGASALFGYSGRSFDDWWKPGQRGDLTQQIFVGPNSPHADMQVYNDDWNNFGPAVGFAWQLPWLGKGKTTLRGGYQVSFLPIGRADSFAGPMANTIGTSYTNVYQGDSSRTYLDFATLPSILPLPIPSNAVPLSLVPVTARSQGLTIYDQNLRNPYIQSLTLALVRNFGSNVTLDVRYIGTLNRKSIRGQNLNDPNLISNGLKDAFQAARDGGESTLLDNMFKGVNYAGSGYGPVGTEVNGVMQTGAMHLRGSSTTWANLANGNFVGVANTLATANYSTRSSGNAGLPPVPTGINGALLRYTGYPENFIYTNPQFSAATINGNMGYNNYHAMQAQITLRPTAGFSLVGTYTWSRNLGILTTQDPNNRAADYGLTGQHRSHTLATYGTYDVPLGKGRKWFSGSNSFVDAFIGGWQVSWIYNATTGSPASVGGQQTLWGGSNPDFVGPAGSFDNKSGKVTWEPGSAFGSYFNFAYDKVPDPQCAQLTTKQSLNTRCTLQALALASDHSKIVFQNAKPMTRGNFGPNMLTNPGRWTLDATMGKTFRIAEGKSFSIRADATNIFNHPTPSYGYATVSTRTTIPSNPSMTLSGAQRFGELNNKVGVRFFQFKLRFDF